MPPADDLDDQGAQKHQDAHVAHIEKIEHLGHYSFKSNPLPRIDDTLNSLEVAMGMPVQKALEIWRSAGAPMIHPGPGENCEDLESAADGSNPDCLERHLEIVKQWLTDKQRKNRERS